MELYIADSPYSITCNINKTVTNSSKEIFLVGIRLVTMTSKLRVKGEMAQ